ncbi:MAG: UvrD-helicase domain-containing protein, partial [Lysinibacillus sp.]|nr:UvrD-helicase domain-containing protein [Lysinibacillus sp.]
MTNLIVDKDARDKILTNLHTNFLVEAGAGSGKTTSLVGRMVNIIATGTGTVDEIVAITFTKKAADELKMRFQSELEKAMKKDPLNKERIAEGLQNIDQIYLGTVHSFCAKLLRERPIEANLDIDFQELDDDGDFLLLQEAWDEYLFKVQDEQPEALQQMEELGLSVEKLFESLRTLKEYPDVEWVVDEVEKPDLKPTYRALMNILYEARRAIPDKEPEKGFDDVQKLILKAIRREKVVASPTEKDLLTILESFDKNIKVTQNRWVTKEDAKFYAGKLQDFVESSIKPQLKQWREYVHPKIIRFLKGAYDHYAQLKKERSLLNFQDLLMKTADLLKSNP